MSISLPDLPYSNDALQPHISTETIEYHYGKHHRSYVTKLNEAISGTEFQNMALEDIVRQSSGGVFNNAAQVWNHTFYWNSLSPTGGGEPSGSIAEVIDKSFGSFSSFKADFTKAATSLFGSGWVWLLQASDGTLSIEKTSNADTPLKGPHKALLTCDVWEHAYYVDYRNARPQYIAAFWELVNWDFANSNIL